MKKIFLASSFKNVAHLLPDFVGDVRGRTATFIPTASVGEQLVFCVVSGRKALEKLGIVVDELDVSTATGTEIESKLARNDFIYAAGGNSFFLLQEMKKSGADKLIKEQVREGKVYIGESAGAIVAAPDIEFARSMDSVKRATELVSYDGLDMIEFYPVPHYKSFPFRRAVEKTISAYGSCLPLQLIGNRQAILVRNDNGLEEIFRRSGTI